MPSSKHRPLLRLILSIALLGYAVSGSAEPANSSSDSDATPSATVDKGSSVDGRAEEAGEYIELKPMRTKYSAKVDKGIPFRGTARQSLVQREDGLWEFRFEVDSFIADIRESLLLRWTGRQVVPLEYRYSLEGMMISNRYAELDFDWEKSRVRNDVKGKPWYMDIHEGVLDKLGFQLQLRQDLKAGKTQMVYEIADGGRLKEYEFKVVGEETIESENHGKVDTILVEKVREPYKKRETHLWFAPQWDYLLVRMVQIEDDGTRYEINLDEARLPGQRIE